MLVDQAVHSGYVYRWSLTDEHENPVSQVLVPINGDAPPTQAELQCILKDQLQNLEMKYDNRLEKIKKVHIQSEQYITVNLGIVCMC